MDNLWTISMDMFGGFNPTPLKNIDMSIGMMTFPAYGKIKDVPNHQPVLVDFVQH